MHRLSPIAFLFLLGCASAALEGADTARPGPADLETCSAEGEPCTDFGDGTSDCCITRHTCFAEGCFYTQP